MTRRIFEDLDLDAIEPGEVVHGWLDLVHGGMGEPVRLPLLIAKGTRAGPVAGVTAAVHGNEVNGIPVIHRLFRKLEPNRLRGTVVAVPVVNVPAYLLRQRRTDDGVDLNHVFPGQETGREAVVYAGRFFDRIVRSTRCLLKQNQAVPLSQFALLLYHQPPWVCTSILKVL